MAQPRFLCAPQRLCWQQERFVLRMPVVQITQSLLAGSVTRAQEREQMLCSPREPPAAEQG